jgi:hypothetical protein
MPVVRVPSGTWRPSSATLPPGTVALGVLEGLLLRETGAPGGASLSGPGDLVEPWGAHPELRWTACGPVRLAVVGRPLLSALRPWPDALGRLLGRALRQEARALGAQAVLVTHGDDQRVLCLLGHLAERWGERVAGGTVVAQALDSELLGRLAGVPAGGGAAVARRLGERGLANQRSDGSWLLPAAGAGRRDRAATREALVAAFNRAGDAYAAALATSAELARDVGRP